MKTSDFIPNVESPSPRTLELFRQQQQSIIGHTDRLFGNLMIFQWAFGVLLAFCVSPRTWAGTSSQMNPHVWAAIFLGGVITSVPVVLSRIQPGKLLTRHAIAVG